MLFRDACATRVVTGEKVKVRSDDLTEASGMVASRRRPGWFWTHNDSGDGPRIFGIGPGGQAQVVSVSDAAALDWEDIAPDRTAAGDGLWLGDIGDNREQRSSIDLYRVPEPDAATRSVAAARLTLQYPDGSHNAEALLRDPADGGLVILAKEPTTARIYTFDPPDAGGGRGRLRAGGQFRIGDAPGKVVTGADVSPDRSTIAVRTYGEVWLYRLRPTQSIPDALGTKPCKAPAAVEVQGEAVAFLADSRGYATISEGRRPTISEYRSPEP